MKIDFGEIKQDHSRDLYWVCFSVHQGDSEARIAACASWEWLADNSGTPEITEKELKDWLSVIERDLKNDFDLNNRHLVYATTDLGYGYGKEFLAEHHHTV